MEILPFQLKDQKRVLKLYKNVTRDLRSKDNDQWDHFYPNRIVIKRDLTNQSLYGIIEDDLVIGAVVIDGVQNEKYEKIRWHDHSGIAACIHRLAVQPQSQGKGIGKELLNFAEQQARSLGYTSIRLDVYSKNIEAVGMYTKNGYVNRGMINFPLRKLPFYCLEKQLK